MKILKLLNEKFLFILLILISSQVVFSQEAVDIWNIQESNSKKNKTIGDSDN